MTNKQKAHISSDSNPIEAGRQFVSDVGKSFVKDFAAETGIGFFKQLLNLPDLKSSDHAPESNTSMQTEQKGIEIFNFKNLHQQSESAKKPQVQMKKKTHQEKSSHQERRAAIAYHEQFQQEVAESGHKYSHREIREMNQRVNEIMAELHRLVQSSKMLQVQFREVTTEQGPANVGTYHMNFFEWMLIVIKQAREKVEDSGAWLSTVKGKGAKKKSGYWEMFKKNGTSFAMSNERAVATQVG